MTLVLLRRVPVANVAPATGYTVEFNLYDTQARRPYQDALQATTNTGANAPFELTIGDLVPGASFCYGGTQRQVRYAGNGTVSTRDVLGAPACASALSPPALSFTSPPGTTAYDQAAQLTATWSGAVGPVTVRCALLVPGSVETLPFYEERALPANTTTALFPAIRGQASVPPFDTRNTTRRFTAYNPNTGMGPGRYRVEVTEESTGQSTSEELTIDLASPSSSTEVRLWGDTPASGPSFFSVLTNGPLRVVLRRPQSAVNAVLTEIYLEPAAPGNKLLRLVVEPSSATRVRLRAWVYQPASNSVGTGEIFLDNATYPALVQFGDALPYLSYALAASTPVGGSALSPVVSNGQGGAMGLAYNPAQRLALDNLILFHPPRPSDATGAVIVEARTAFDTHANQTSPLSYELRDSAGTTLQSNATGRFSGLLAGAYSVLVDSAAAPALSVPVLLEAAYGLRWRMAFADLKNHQPCRVEFWVRGYSGPVESICGQEEPVTLATEGLAGGNTQADLPDALGSTLTLRLRAAPQALQDVVLDDRACRTDFYYGDALQFSGYVQPEIYQEALLSGPVNVELTAACGLGSLKDVDFAGHEGQELRGRYPRINTLLHCLSRTGLSLPLTVATNLVAAEMLSDETPEEIIYTDRLGYAGMDQRAVVNALCQSLGGTLVQRGGQWVIISALEAAKAAPARRYTAAGSARQLLSIPSPAGRLVPSETAKAAAAGPTPPAKVFYWLRVEQQLQRRAGWRFFTGTADAAYATNAFRQGEAFSDATFWDASATVLRPEAGWQAGPGSFPVSLVEAGGESQEVATLWPQAADYSDARYLESELAPLEAGREGVAFSIALEGKYVGRPNQTASVWVEVVYERSGPVSTGALLQLKAVAGVAAGFTTATALLPAGLLNNGQAPRLRVHPYTVFPLERRDPRSEDGFLLIKSVAVQVLPQGAKWDGKTAFVASGPGGSVRPGTPLEVFHVDAPAKAGLFLGTVHAFRRTVTRQPVGPTTQWARADDLRGAPLLATAVLDVLALRGNPSRLLTGAVRHLGLPPEALDAVDLPYDVPGRRWLVGARAWDVKANRSSITLIEIGIGERLSAATPFLPQGVQVLRGLAGGQRRVLLSRRPNAVRALRP